MGYEELLEEAISAELMVSEASLIISEGRIKGNKIAINKGMSENKKKCILAEELGHFWTSVGDIIDQTNPANRKQEHRARVWAFDKLIGLKGIVAAYNRGCSTLYELSEFWDVTEAFAAAAIECYRSKYGYSAKCDDCTIYFDPLNVSN